MKKIKEIIEPILPYISLSEVAQNYYGKSRHWFYHKLNENIVNNTKYQFNDIEVEKLIIALQDIDNKLNNSIKELNNLKKEYNKGKIKNIIFDFDCTLINRSISDEYWKKGEWEKVYAMIPQFTYYSGLKEVFDFLITNDYKIIIVSFAKRSLIEKTAKHFKIPYHYIKISNEKEKKPKLNAFLKVLEKMNCDASNVISIGDGVMEFRAANAVGIKHIACLWGSSNDEKLLKKEGCKHFIEKPLEIIDYLC